MKSQNDYINDPYFMKWIFQPDSLSEQYWASFMETHPEEKMLILSLKEELNHLRLKNKDLTDNEKKLLLEQILRKKDRNSRLEKVRWFKPEYLRYAAIAIIFLAIGNVLMYMFLKVGQDNINLAEFEYTIPVDKPKLILSDGSGVELEEKSTVTYHANNQIVVDDQVVDVASNQDGELSTNQIIIPSGSRSMITLSDNSVVYLNAGSKLVYPSAFNGNEREVLLFGEAFFEVSKNEKQPFIVRTPSLSVKVLGTKFNVSAYSEDNVVQTVLVEGEVSIKRNDAPFFERSIVMKPNQLATFNKKTKDIRTYYVDTEYYTLWKDGMLMFEDEDLSRIVKKLERFYNLKITLEDPLKGSVKISGKMDLSEDKYEVFKYISALTQMEFVEVNSNNYVMK